MLTILLAEPVKNTAKKSGKGNDDDGDGYDYESGYEDGDK